MLSRVRWVPRMSIVKKMNTKRRSSVLERQAPGVPSGLLAIACVPLLAPGAMFGYTYWRNQSFTLSDPVHYLILILPVVLSILLFRRQRQALKQIASVSEAVQLAASGQATATELLISEHEAGPGRSWNGIVRAFLTERTSDTGELSAVSTGISLSAGTILNSLSLAVCGVDRAGNILVANTAADRFFRRDVSQMHGAPLRPLLEEEPLQTFDDVMMGRVQRRNSVDFQRESESSQSDEILRLTVIPTREIDGVYAVVTVEDVTRQRFAEKSRHEFIAQATHELRTPLTNIRLYVEEAIDAGENEGNARSEALNVISHESLRLERLVSELLDISELEAGARVMDKGDVRIDQLMEQIKSDYVAMAESKDVALVFELPPKLPVIQGDRDKIAGALHNLLGNAIKYTPSGGSVTVRLDDEEGVLRFVFIDTGIGITPEEQTRVYDKFFRSADQRVSAIEGTGLGLAFAQQVAQMHGGELTLDSELDHGSTFTFSMPKPKLAA